MRKRALHFRPAPALPIQSLNHIVCTDLRPVLGGEIAVGQHLLNTALNFLQKIAIFFIHAFKMKCVEGVAFGFC